MYVSISVFLKPFHVKDPKNNKYFTADPHLKICCSSDSEKGVKALFHFMHKHSGPQSFYFKDSHNSIYIYIFPTLFFLPLPPGQ